MLCAKGFSYIRTSFQSGALGFPQDIQVVFSSAPAVGAGEYPVRRPQPSRSLEYASQREVTQAHMA